jgi:hypothetical protein
MARGTATLKEAAFEAIGMQGLRPSPNRVQSIMLFQVVVATLALQIACAPSNLSRNEAKALDAADLDEEITGFSARLPAECPYSFEQITGEWLPSSRE